MAVWVQVPLRVPFLYYLTYCVFLLIDTHISVPIEKKIVLYKYLY